MAAKGRTRPARGQTVGRWIDRMIRSLERKAAAPPRRATAQPAKGRPQLDLRRDLNLILGL